jgi:hypothetical protein
MWWRPVNLKGWGVGGRREGHVVNLASKLQKNKKEKTKGEERETGKGRRREKLPQVGAHKRKSSWCFLPKIKIKIKTLTNNSKYEIFTKYSKLLSS